MHIVKGARLALNWHLSASSHFSRSFKLYSSTTMNSLPIQLPSQPRNPLTEFGLSLQASLSDQMSTIDRDLAKDDETKDDFFKKVRCFHSSHDDLLQAVKFGMVDSVPTLLDNTETVLTQLIEATGSDPCARESKLSTMIEKSRATLMLHRFFLEGKVATQASLQPCNDSEYIGAVLTFAQLLNQYSLGRACEGDVQSISLCHAVVTELNTKMLEFDFRNGPLRRKYDGLKYAVRNIEDVLFELSLQNPIISSSSAIDTTCTSSATAASVEESEVDINNPAKRMRLTDTTTTTTTTANSASSTTDINNQDENTQFYYLDSTEIDDIRTRLDRYDQLREQVIKESRDIQKLAKQAVYAVIRQQLGEAHKKLDLAANLAKKIFLIVNEHPTLRQGSFSNSLEEWAEGAITLEWVENKRISTLTELKMINSIEYIGALSDFTGEIGRLAVMYAGKRDYHQVNEIYQADLVLCNAVTKLNGNRFSKKLDAMNTNLKKVGDVIYELSMLQRSGRATRTKVELNEPSTITGEDI